MLDKLFVNIKTILPITNAHNDHQHGYKSSDQMGNDESTIAFIERAAANTNSPSDQGAMNYLRSYFSKFARRKSTATDLDNTFMLPRVYDQTTAKKLDWDPVELKATEKFIEDIDNVIDKFSRVVSVTETQSPRRSKYFYV